MRRALEPWLGGMAAHASSTANAARMISPASIATGAISGAPLGPPVGTAPPALAPTPMYGYAPPSPYGPPPSPPGPPSPPSPPNPPNQVFAMTPAAVTPPPAKSGGAVVGLLVIVVVLLLVVVGGGAAGFYFYSRSAATSPVAAGPSGAAVPAGAGAASGAPAAATAGATTSVAANGTPANNAGAAAPAGARKSAGAAPPVATVAPGAAAPASAPAAIVADAGAKKQFAGTSFRISGGIFESFDIDASKAAIMTKSGAISGCYAATEFDPPDHQFTDWTFQVDPAGNVKSVGRTTSFDPHPKFDACMIGTLRQVKWPASKAGGSPHVSFSARTRDNP
jgi:hypothetical protein